MYHCEIDAIKQKWKTVFRVPFCHKDDVGHFGHVGRCWPFWSFWSMLVDVGRCWSFYQGDLWNLTVPGERVAIINYYRIHLWSISKSHCSFPLVLKMKYLLNIPFQSQLDINNNHHLKYINDVNAQKCYF